MLHTFGCYRPTTHDYQVFYSHLDNSAVATAPSMRESDYFVIFLVDARHLDYTESSSLLKTIAKHPSDGSKNGDVGHAWIYLQGIIEGEKAYIEGGHSGELGLIQAKYFDGIMNYIDYGYANPTEEQKRCPHDEPNPIQYLWATQSDGFFQQGSGGHIPTCAVKVDLTEEEFHRICAFIHPDNYFYGEYALIHNQCTSFIAKVAALIQFPLEYEVTITIPSQTKFRGNTYRLWTDPKYRWFTFSSPDIAERSLLNALHSGRGENALKWYLNHKCSRKFVYVPLPKHFVNVPVPEKLN